MSSPFKSVLNWKLIVSLMKKTLLHNNTVTIILLTLGFQIFPLVITLRESYTKFTKISSSDVAGPGMAGGTFLANEQRK